MGQQCPRDAPDLLPPPAQGRPQRRAAVRGRPAPDDLGRMGRRLARPRRRLATSRSPTPSRARSSRPGSRTASSSSGRPTDFEAYKAKVEPYTLEYAERETGVPAEAIRELAHAFAKAARAMICWTLGITEHHNAVDNVLALIIARAADRSRRSLRQRRQPAARPEQRPGRRRHGRAARPPARASSTSRTTSSAPGSTPSGACRPAQARLAPVRHVRCDGARRPDRGLLHRREPGPVRGRPEAGDRACSRASTSSSSQDLFLTKTAELADVVLPATAAWAETEGTVTNSERRVQRVRKAVDPPPGARDDLAIIFELANRMGAAWGEAGRREPSGTRSAASRRSTPG